MPEAVTRVSPRTTLSAVSRWICRAALPSSRAALASTASPEQLCEITLGDSSRASHLIAEVRRQVTIRCRAPLHRVFAPSHAAGVVVRLSTSVLLLVLAGGCWLVGHASVPTVTVGLAQAPDWRRRHHAEVHPSGCHSDCVQQRLTWRSPLEHAAAAGS